MPTIDQAFAACSPRVSPRPVFFPSRVIHGGVLALFLVLSARGFFADGLLAWSSGLVYIFYDTALLTFVFWRTLPLLKPSEETRARAIDRPPTVGVVIAAYNEGTALPATIAAILAQSSPPQEILIADDGSDDETAQILMRQFGLKPPPLGETSAPSAMLPVVRWLRLPHRGKAEALNAALPVMTSDVIITIDADTFLADGALGAMRDAFATEPGLVAATGVLIPVCNQTTGGAILQWFQHYEYIRNFISRFAWMSVDSLLLISGAFAGYRREALKTVGGFDAECLVEDYEVVHRLHRYSVDHGLDWRFRVLGTAVAKTEAPSTISSFLRQRRRWFAGFLQTQYWNRDMLGNARYGHLGTVMLPIKAVDTLQPVYGLVAILFLLVFIARGQLEIAVPVFSVITAKIVIDVIFYLWAIRLYQRWIGPAANVNYFYAILAAIAEPFSFQLLRHAGASLGWITFLGERRRWIAGKEVVQAPHSISGTTDRKSLFQRQDQISR